jgi:hypothetical protein
MKKVLISIVIVLSISPLAFAEGIKYNPNRPEWNEFCPFGLENPETKETKWYQPYYTKINAKEQNYWAQRKQDFEKSLNFCDKVEAKHQNACYEKIKTRQINLNNNHVTALKESENVQAQIMQLMHYSNHERRLDDELDLKKQQVDIQRMYVQNQNMPKTYNVNLNHNVKYNSYGLSD